MGRPRDMEGIRSRGIVLFAVGVCLLLATVVVLERDVDEQPVASYTTDMAPHAALTAAATKRAAFKASIKAAFLRAVGKTPPATALHHRQSLFPDSFRVLKLQARQSKYRERNARFHNDKGYGRRLLGGKSTRNERRRRRFRVATKAMRERRWKKHKKANAKGCAKMPAPPVQAT